MDEFDEIEDADLFEVIYWTENKIPTLPKVYRREKRALGGEIAIVRDISTSMMGTCSEWASSVIRGIIKLARVKKMRVGYIEFNHKSYKYKKAGRFFINDYEWMLSLASRTECFGNTNYEDALKEAIPEFQRKGLRNKHILFITDGIPTSGNCDIPNERALARKLGICIHSIFIGSDSYPKILERISTETGGAQFVAIPDSNGAIRVQRKEKRLML
jgi:uncharacterized protein with von Willebrand factor type A (vWA) domain